MSKLIFGLKGKNKLDGKTSIYLSKKLLQDVQVRDLKRVCRLNSSAEVIKFCLSFYAFYSLDLNRELYEQLKYSKMPNEFFRKQENFRETITLKEFEEDFIKIEVLNWHLIVCLNKYESGFEDSFDVIREIIRFSWELRVKTSNWEREEKFRLGVTDIFQNNIHNLRILHGHYNESNLIKKCLEFYAYNFDGNKISGHLKSYSEESMDEATGLFEIELELSNSIAENLYFQCDKVNDIQKIIDYNLRIFQNLFPERSLKNGEIT